MLDLDRMANLHLRIKIKSVSEMLARARKNMDLQPNSTSPVITFHFVSHRRKTVLLKQEKKNLSAVLINKTNELINQ